MKASRQAAPATWKFDLELFRPINEITARNEKDVGMAFGPRSIFSFESEIIADFRDLTRGIAS